MVFQFLLRLCLLLQRYTFWSNSQLPASIATPSVNCACYCKDTHFEAIHNLLLRSWSVNTYCACYCKDTHFEAIHNQDAGLSVAALIVLATAKIHILKQFTTKSARTNILFYCACYCKDTHFEAIHNLTTCLSTKLSIVFATVKIHIPQRTSEAHGFWLSLNPQECPNGRLCKLKPVFWLLVSLACCLTALFLAFSWMRSWLLRRTYRPAAKGWPFAESINHLRFLHLCLLDAVR